MKITLIHGDHVTLSRERFYSIMSRVKARGWEVVHLNGQDLSALDGLINASLFNTNQLYVIEDVDKIPSHELKWLEKNHTRLETNLLIWHRKELGQRLIRSLPKNTSFEVFKLPKIIFTFLEDIKPKNAASALKKLQVIKKTEPPEFVLALLAQHLRDLTIAKLDGNLPYPNWRANKIIAQARAFDESRLKSFIKDLAQADVDAKTGGPPLATSLDLILMTHLE